MDLVVWYQDIWGWGDSPETYADDLLRELEVGAKVMTWERLENTVQELYFLMLAKAS